MIYSFLLREKGGLIKCVFIYFAFLIYELCRFWIREKILLNYRDEIPYACEVIIESFKETETNAGEKLARIQAIIYVARDNQKLILIGKNGLAMKKLGMDARKDMEKFLESKVFLEMTVKVRDNWRDDERMLKNFGYTT